MKIPELSEVRITTEKARRQINIEIKKSLSVLELSALVRIIEMKENDIKLVDLSYEKRLELLLETL